MSVRLVNYWVPQSYDLDLSVSLRDWHTYGEEVVSLAAPATPEAAAKAAAGGASPSTFTLHAGAAMKILSVGKLRYTLPCGTTHCENVNGETGGASVAVSARCDARQTVTFALNGVPEGAKAVAFTIKFDNPINPELRGLYRCTYKETAAPAVTATGDGATAEEAAPPQLVERRMASTHFEPVGARLMYPCVDEPAVRVAFLLTVRLPTDLSGYTVLSNAPVESRTVHPHDMASPSAAAPSPSEPQSHFPIVYKFQEVTAIPTYLTALVIGDLEYIECLGTAEEKKEAKEGEVEVVPCPHRSNTPIRFYAVKGKAAKARYALEVARFSLHFFEKFFQSKFPMPKLDLVAVPDFPIGGMENWGCICVTETCLMPYEKESDNSVAKLKGVCNLITHEVSHNWFGNLVGIDWWDGLWLKEGFATWCGIQGTIAFRPALREDHSFYGDMNGALGVDGFAGSHPIEVAIDDPADITQVFDAISYDKGMAVCNMLQAYLGPQRFSDGLAAYVRTYAYKNTTTVQLWVAIEEATGMPVAEVMESFTNQKGFPLVSVALAAADSVSNSAAVDFSKPVALAVSQEKFAYLGCPEHLPDAIWRVPLRIVVVEADTGAIVVDHRTVLADKKSTITIPAVPNSNNSDKKHVLLVNPGGSGFYRVHYESPALAGGLFGAYGSLPELFRRAVLNDLVSVYMCGKQSLGEVVALLTASITSEESFAIFNDALEGASFLQGTLACGCGKHHGARLDGSSAAEAEAEAAAATPGATSATADAAGTIASALRLAVSTRCEGLSLKLLAAGASLTPEQKMMRTYALGASYGDRKRRLAKEIEAIAAKDAAAPAAVTGAVERNAKMALC